MTVSSAKSLQAPLRWTLIWSTSYITAIDGSRYFQIPAERGASLRLIRVPVADSISDRQQESGLHRRDLLDENNSANH